MHRILSFFCLYFLMLLVTSCKVGPNYRLPETCLPETFTEDRTYDRCHLSDEALIQWWKIFHDPFLDQLLEEAVCGSFDYLIALEKVYQAREQYRIQSARVMPEIDFNAQGSRYRISPSVLPSLPGVSPTKSLFQIGLDAIWEIDLFGKLRRSADASYDLWEATAADAHAVKIIVLSEVAITYMTICTLQKNIDVQSQLIAIDEQLFKTADMRFNAGVISRQEVETFNAAQQFDQAALLALKTSLRQKIYSLAILLGRTPEEVVKDFLVIRPIPYALNPVPSVGIPGDLLRRRPDILAAERRLAAATEQKGVAVANLFPSISLIGSGGSSTLSRLPGANVGFASNKIENLFNASNFSWGAGGFINWPVFDFGARTAAVNVQTSLIEQAYLNYQKTVISALAEAESALAAYFNDKQRYSSLKNQVEANLKNLRLAEDLYKNGLINSTQLTQAKQIWISSLNAFVDTQMSLDIDIVHLYKAMGGDW